MICGEYTLDLQCDVCGIEENFAGFNKHEAFLAVAEDGWKLVLSERKAICKKCQTDKPI